MGCWILEKYSKASVHQPVMVMSYTKFGDGKIISLLTLDYLMKRQGHLAGTIYHEENPMGIQLSPWNQEITGTNATPGSSMGRCVSHYWFGGRNTWGLAIKKKADLKPSQ